MRFNGTSHTGSQRAWDLYVKSRFVETKNPGRALVLASGTPITNTLGEMFSVQRFLGIAALKERGLHEFDAWASTFGDVTTDLELQPSGKYKPVTRFATFVNVPELIAMFRSFADVVLPEDLRQYVKVPAVATGKRQIRTSRPSAAFKRYQTVLDARIKAIEERETVPSQCRNQRLDNIDAVIRRECGPRGNILCLLHMLRPEGRQPQMLHREGMVFVPGISPDGIVVERTSIDLKLLCKPGDQFSGRHKVFAPSQARVAQQGNMHRKPKVVFGAASGTDQVNVISAQQIVTDQGFGICRHPEEFRIRAGGKKSAGHKVSSKRRCKFEDAQYYRD